jgi:hypothetical protein
VQWAVIEDMDIAVGMYSEAELLSVVSPFASSSFIAPVQLYLNTQAEVQSLFAISPIRKL